MKIALLWISLLEEISPAENQLEQPKTEPGSKLTNMDNRGSLP